MVIRARATIILHDKDNPYKKSFMDNWKILEKNLVTHSIMQKVHVFKFPEDVKLIQNRLIRKKTSFDFVASFGGVSAFFDAKVETTNNVFNFKSRIFNEEKIHQWTALKRLSEDGIIAGYIIWLHKAGKIGWASVGAIESMLAQGIKSIDPEAKEVVWQNDQDPINLKLLMINEIRQWMMNKPHVNTLQKIL